MQTNADAVPIEYMVVALEPLVLQRYYVVSDRRNLIAEVGDVTALQGTGICLRLARHLVATYIEYEPRNAPIEVHVLR